MKLKIWRKSVKVNIYTNKGSRQKDAIQFALWCIERNIEMDKLSDKEIVYYKRAFDKEHWNSNGWHP